MSENKTSRYFKYAIGEIILVVIGILIAVAINSKYSKAQNQQKIDSILVQIQKELLIDIADAERIFDVKMGKDSLARKIYFSTVTEKEFLKDPFPLMITNNYVSFTTQKGGYNRLIQNLENLPEEYQYILPYFNDLYVERQNDIDDYNETIKNTVMVVNRNNLNKNPKNADYRLGLLSREASLKYIFNDPFLKNRTGVYMNDLMNISTAANDYKIEAIKLYKNIDSLLGSKSNKVKLKALPSQDSIQPFAGVYQEIGKEFGFPDQNLTIKKDHLLVSSANESISLFWHKGNYFYQNNVEGSYKYYKNEAGQRIITFSSALYKVKFIHKDDIKESL